MITGIQYGIVASTKTRVRCVFCGVYIPKANKCIEEHNNGAKHKEIMVLVNENGISYNMSQGLYCKLCDTIIPDKETIVQHLQMEEHANWLATLNDLIDGEFINVERFLASQTDNAYCEPCLTAIPCTLQNVEEHVNDETHHNNVTESVKPLNGLFDVEERHEVWCKICDVYIEDAMPALIDHIQNYEHHVDWMNMMEQHTDEDGIYIGNYLAHEFENKVYCLKCRAEILCHVDSIDYHVQTEAHLNSDLPDLDEITALLFQPHEYLLN